METVFKNINIDKRDKIINSALEEFSKYGFEKASINSIVKNASTSKGFLYHHFNGKEELYNYLEEFVLKTILQLIKEKIDWNQSDIFIRIKQISLIEFNLKQIYPYIYKFISKIYENRNVDKIEGIFNEDLVEFNKKIYQYNIDFSKFKNQENMEEKINIIKWSIEKFGEEYIENVKNSKDIIDYDNYQWKKFDEYIEVLKRAFYE